MNTLLPIEIRGFRRATFDEPECAINDLIEVEYRSQRGTLSITFSNCSDSESAQEAVAVAQAEVTAVVNHPGERLSLNTEPSFFRTAGPGDAFIAWSRGNYFFSASARGKSSEKVLDRFMKAFPY